jgi:hypothetical protein
MQAPDKEQMVPPKTTMPELSEKVIRDHEVYDQVKK